MLLLQLVQELVGHQGGGQRRSLGGDHAFAQRVRIVKREASRLLGFVLGHLGYRSASTLMNFDGEK